jgi:hypothetical protein
VRKFNGLWCAWAQATTPHMPADTQFAGDAHFHRHPLFFVMHTFSKSVVLDVAPPEIMEGGR